MDSKIFSDYCSGFQNIIIALAVIIGGVWTLISFEALNQREIAKAQLEEINKRIERVKIPALSLNVNLIKMEEEESIYQIKVEATNIGNEVLKLSYPNEESFQITLITGVEKYGLTIDSSAILRPKLIEHHYIGAGQVHSSKVPPNATITVQTLAKLRRKSIYQISFKARLSDNLTGEGEQYTERGVSEFLFVD